MSDRVNEWLSKYDDEWIPDIPIEDEEWPVFRRRALGISDKRKPLVIIKLGDESWCPITLE